MRRLCAALARCRAGVGIAEVFVGMARVDGIVLPRHNLAMHERTHRLRSIVAQQGWSLAQLAEAIGRKKRTARSWCAGASIVPEHTLELLELRLARAEQATEVGA